MSYQRKGLQFSFVIHATMLLAVLFLSGSLGHFSKPVVIDFSIEVPVMKGAPKTSPTSRSREVETRQPEQAVQQPEPVKEEKVTLQEDAPKQVVATSDSTPQTQAQVETSGPVQSVRPTGNTPSTANISLAEGPASSHPEETSSETTKQGYFREHFVYIKNIVQRKITYPRIARRMGWEGKVVISFVVCLDGRAKDIMVRQGSGFELLDRNAVEAVQSASPFPKPPVEAQLVIPISYTLN